MKSSPPVVSVIIPTYNRADLLPQAIRSVLAQTFQDLELVVVDDGSTDNTAATVEAFGRQVRFLRQPNQGTAAARNHGIRESVGRYVAFLDSDDLWLPAKLARQVAVLNSEPEAGLVYTQTYWLNDQGEQLRRPPHGHDQVDTTLPLDRLLLGNAVCGGGSSAMVRRAALDRAGLFDEQISHVEDWDLWLRIGRFFRLKLIPEPLCYYRINSGGFRNWAPRSDQVDTIHRHNLTVLHKALACGAGGTGSDTLLARDALAHEYLRHALVNYGLDRVPEGLRNWHIALELSPAYATDRQVLWGAVTAMIAGQMALTHSGTWMEQSETILHRILENLPAPVAGFQQDQDVLLAHILGQLAAMAAESRQGGVARRCALRCLALDPSRWRNLGLVKIVVNGGRHLWPRVPEAIP